MSWDPQDEVPTRFTGDEWGLQVTRAEASMQGLGLRPGHPDVGGPACAPVPTDTSFPLAPGHRLLL